MRLQYTKGGKRYAEARQQACEQARPEEEVASFPSLFWTHQQGAVQRPPALVMHSPLFARPYWAWSAAKVAGWPATPLGSSTSTRVTFACEESAVGQDHSVRAACPPLKAVDTKTGMLHTSLLR